MVEATTRIKPHLRFDPWVLKNAYQGATCHVTDGEEYEGLNFSLTHSPTADWCIVDSSHSNNGITVFAGSHFEQAHFHHTVDVRIVLHETGIISRSVAARNTFDEWLTTPRGGWWFTTWGPGRIYDTILPICLISGVKNIILHTWPLTIEEQQIVDVSKEKLHAWLSTHGVCLTECW